MGKIAKNLISLIGNTPLLELGKYNRAYNLNGTVIAKLENFNPGGSLKDRTAYAMIKEAEETGQLKPDSTIVEATSGNTGIALSYIAAVKGYKIILTMPETMTIERRNLLTALGAQIVLTPGHEGMRGAIKKAEEIALNTENVFRPRQFKNKANPKIHEITTATEIWSDTDGQVDIVVAGVGTGGTVSGVGTGLKKRNPAIQIVAVEPKSSPALKGGKAAAHRIQGIGAGFIPEIYDENVVDEIYDVEDEEAIQATRNVAKYEGLLVGISSGAVLHAATEIARRRENKGKLIVAILPDTGERYLSTTLFGKDKDR